MRQILFCMRRERCLQECLSASIYTKCIKVISSLELDLLGFEEKQSFYDLAFWNMDSKYSIEDGRNIQEKCPKIRPKQSPTQTGKLFVFLKIADSAYCRLFRP